MYCFFFFFFQAEDGIRDRNVTGVQTCALPISVVVYSLLFGWLSTTVADYPPWLRFALGAAVGVLYEGANLMLLHIFSFPRSEERRVGKECRSRWWPDK